MSYTTYETPSTWVPDETYINSSQGIHYLAWKIGIDSVRNKNLWLIEPVRTSPHDLTSLLPVGTLVGELLDDTLRYGHRRAVYTKLSINQLVAAYTAEVATVTDIVTAGFR